MSTERKERRHDSEPMSDKAKCALTFLIIAAEFLLIGAMALVLYWVLTFLGKKDEETNLTYYFSWKGQPHYDVATGFNYHPVLMVGGFIFCSGHAILTYRSYRYCRRIWNKLIHALFNLLAVPCIAFGFIAVWDSHNERVKTSEGGDTVKDPIPNFYSLHSWMGLVTMGFFALQYAVGFFSFLILLCCESMTSSFRACMVPVHSIIGIATFVMAVATCCSGITEKAFFVLSLNYSKWVRYAFDKEFDPAAEGYTKEMMRHSVIINSLGLVLLVLGITMTVIVMHPRFRRRAPSSKTISVSHDRYG